MARRIYFSFDYHHDVQRVNLIRRLPNVTACAAAGFQDATTWAEAERAGDAAIHRLIDQGLEDTSVTVVCIGASSAAYEYANYEIQESERRGNAILGLQIHQLEDRAGRTGTVGPTPSRLKKPGGGNYKYEVFKYSDPETLLQRIELAANPSAKGPPTPAAAPSAPDPAPTERPESPPAAPVDDTLMGTTLRRPKGPVESYGLADASDQPSGAPVEDPQAPAIPKKKKTESYGLADDD